MLIRLESGSDYWLQFQGKGQNLWFLQLRKALQHKIKATSSRSLYLGFRRALFDLLLREATNRLARQYFREHNKTEITRSIFYVSYTSVKHWISQDYYLTGLQCLDLIELESKRFYNYCAKFFKAVWPRESSILDSTHDAVENRLENGDFDLLLTTPVDPKALTSKELAAEYGAWLSRVRKVSTSKKPNYSCTTNG